MVSFTLQSRCSWNPTLLHVSASDVSTVKSEHEFDIRFIQFGILQNTYIAVVLCSRHLKIQTKLPADFYYWNVNWLCLILFTYFFHCYARCTLFEQKSVIFRWVYPVFYTLLRHRERFFIDEFIVIFLNFNLYSRYWE